ncbi:MAG: restriction endonuclease subunit R, partial [Cyanobacteria bacterium J06555_13]
WFELQHFKGDRGWHNLNLPQESLQPLLLNKDWYTLYIPPQELEFTRFECVHRWEEIAVALLKKYIGRYYQFKKQAWEAEFYEYHELNEADPNFLTEYRLQVEASQQAILDQLKALQTTIASGMRRSHVFFQADDEDYIDSILKIILD